MSETPKKYSHRMVGATCQRCQRPFMARAARVEQGMGKYCSQACDSAAKKAVAEPVETRFWRQVAKTDECWEWQGPMLSTGYGQFYRVVEGKRQTASTHRVSYEFANGPIPDGLYICHKCDNRKCVRPDHLFAATQKDNMADMVSKGRQIQAVNSTFCKQPELIRGEAHHSAVLAESDVRSIRERHINGESSPKLAHEFGVSNQQIWRIVNRKVWRHID